MDALRVLLPVSSGYRGIDIFAVVVSVIALLCCSTYLITSTLFFIGLLSDRRHKGKEPLTLPYWIPFLGSAISMTRGGHDFYESTIKKASGHIIGARLGPMYTYFVTGAKNTQIIFRNSKSLSSDFLILEVYKNVIGIPAKDVEIFAADKSGSFAEPLADIPEEQRIWRHVHEAQRINFSNGRNLDILTKVFTEEFLKIMDDQPLDEWRTVPFYKFFRNRMTIASTISLVGRGIFKQNPNIIADFWEYMDGFMNLFFGLPRFFIPKVWDARERLKNAGIGVLRSIEDKYNDIQAADPDWDENLGSRVNRLSDKAFKDQGISLEGRGTLMSGFLIGINANAIPVTCWMMIEALRIPGLMGALRKEILTAVIPNEKEPEKIEFDMPKLLALPLMTSVFTETLRLRISTTPTRELRTDLEVDGYILKAGNNVMLPSWIAHTSPEWSVPGHPATSFWPERFLPAEKGSANVTPKPGTYFPWGGGSSMCAGRFFAKQEIFTAVGIMLVKFDLEFVEFVQFDGKKSERGPEPENKNLGAGAVVPDRDITVRIRRRL